MTWWTHEHRRDLRALRTLCAWLGHDDSKALNTLDVLTEEDGTPFIKHYLIDFGASLGSASFMANSPRDGNVYLFDWKSSAAQFFTLGTVCAQMAAREVPEAARQRAASSTRSSIRRSWVGDYPNAAFRNENPADRLWAARKIAGVHAMRRSARWSRTGRYTRPRGRGVGGALPHRAPQEDRRRVPHRNRRAGPLRSPRRAARVGYVGRRSPAPVQVQWSVFDNQTGRAPHAARRRPGTLPDWPEPVDTWWRS